MNYNEFMKAVDDKLSLMSEAEKTEWIHNIARTTKVNNRIAFLNSLNEKQYYCPIIYEKEKIEKWCSKIENREIYFECNSYEDYGEDYWNSDYVYDYYDIFEIEKDLSRAFQVAEDLLFQKEYKESSILYDRLLKMSFSTLDRDMDEWYELELYEIIDENLITLDFKRIVLNFMYVIYQTTKGKERASVLYKYITWNICNNLKIEEIFIIGPEELEGIDSFMNEWVSFLIGMDEDRAGELLMDACLYQGGISRLCEIARAEYLRHPVLYKYACEYLLNEKKVLECEKIGLEAIRVLPENLIIRGKIADLTAGTAIKLRHPDIVNKCYKTAFYSESTLNNYLRLFELYDYENITDKAAKYMETLPEDSICEFHCRNKQMMINAISKNNKDIIKFFNGEFDYIYYDCKKDKSTLGWSSRFKGIAIPLFILLLNKNMKITKAGEKLINEIKHRLGLLEDDAKNFIDRFLNWREKIALTNDQYEKYIVWLKEEVDKRVDAIVGGRYRNSYYKAAFLIATLGETLESNGMVNGRTDMIEHYKKIHTRKRAFKAEFEMLN